MNITINNPSGLYYGVYDNSGTWTQADNENEPTHFAILDELPDGAGVYSGTVYEQESELINDKARDVFDIEYKPQNIGTHTATITLDSYSVSVSGECENDTDIITPDASLLLNNILGQYRK